MAVTSPCILGLGWDVKNQTKIYASDAFILQMLLGLIILYRKLIFLLIFCSNIVIKVLYIYFLN